MAAAGSVTDIAMKRSKAGVTFEVKVEPRSSRRGLSGIMDDGTVKVKLTAPPVEGAANEQLIAIVSEALSVPKSRVSILRGTSSKRKVVEIAGMMPEELHNFFKDLP